MQFENLTKGQFIRDFKDTLHQEQLIRVAKATPTEIFTALAGLIRKYYTDTWIERKHALSDNQEKIAFYFSIEFLPGRMLETNLLNLGILDLVKECFAELDIDFREVVEAEHDMALGNGGLGRLAVEIPEEYELDYPTLEARRRVKDITAILYPNLSSRNLQPSSRML